jgi:hypothetical protein
MHFQLIKHNHRLTNRIYRTFVSVDCIGGVVGNTGKHFICHCTSCLSTNNLSFVFVQ